MFFWISLAFSMFHQMLTIWSLVPLPFLNPAWTSGSSWFTYCWSLAWRVMSIILLVFSLIYWHKFFQHSTSMSFSSNVKGKNPSALIVPGVSLSLINNIQIWQPAKDAPLWIWTNRSKKRNFTNIPITVSECDKQFGHRSFLI